MKRISTLILVAVALLMPRLASAQGYVPTEEILKSREEFADSKFGVFLHWGLYSMFAQGEWYMNRGIDSKEYAKSMHAFYPHRFDAAQWVSAIKAAGAKYICFTSRHHEGFSMWDTKQSDYNIMNTPYGKDVIRQLADECHRQGIKLHLYYSHIDWTREDYPAGRTGRNTKSLDNPDWDGYYKFMNEQLKELLTNYGEIGAIWFDGWWDHDSDSVPFDWQLPYQYELIHKLQPSCLVGNNHHQVPFEGEDIQIFERDVPGENKAGLSGQAISRLPLETCQTMNGMWGYKVTDQNYKSTETLVRYLVSTAGKGANLLLNVGPQPNGELPAVAVERLKEMGEWLAKYGDTIYGTEAGDVKPQQWGCTTRKGNKLYIHIFELEDEALYLPLECKVVGAKAFDTGAAVKFQKVDGGIVLKTGKVDGVVDYVVELTTK